MVFFLCTVHRPGYTIVDSISDMGSTLSKRVEQLNMSGTVGLYVAVHLGVKMADTLSFTANTIKGPCFEFHKGLITLKPRKTGNLQKHSHLLMAKY